MMMISAMMIIMIMLVVAVVSTDRGKGCERRFARVVEMGSCVGTAAVIRLSLRARQLHPLLVRDSICLLDNKYHGGKTMALH